MLLERLGLSVGDEILLGNATLKHHRNRQERAGRALRGLRLRATADGQPCRRCRPRARSRPAVFVEHAYKIKLDDPRDSGAVRDRRRQGVSSAGWSIRTSDRAAPSLTENITRFSQFLTLVGLTALIVGGVGVANAVRAFLDPKRTTIATFKCLGAPASVVVLDLSVPDRASSPSLASLIGLVLGAIVAA